MRRIRTKLGLSLLVVMLIPLVPSFYLVKGLVNRSFEIFFNRTVETAVEGATSISRELYGHFKQESLERSVALAEAETIVEMLRGRATREGEEQLAQVAGPLGPCIIELYDTQGNLVSSYTRLEEGPGEREGGEKEREEEEGGGRNIGAHIAELAFAGVLAKAESGIPIEAHRERLADLARMEEAEVLEGSDDPGYVSVCVPIRDGGMRLGFAIVVRVMEEEFARGARHIMAMNRIFRTLDYYKEDLRRFILGSFSFFCALLVVLAMGVGYVFSRRITAPLLTLVEGTRTVAAGDLDYRISVSSKDEIGQLMDSFNKMIVAIKENQRLAREREQERQRAEEENRRRARDLELAEFRARALQAENERQTIELQKSQELERAYQELEESHRRLQEAQAQLILQEKMASLGAMVAGVAHEINNPMGAVRSAADVVRRCIDRVEQAMAGSGSLEILRVDPEFRRSVGVLRENVQVIHQAEERITTLVESLKNFARLDEAEFQMADLHEGLDATLKLLEPQLGAGIEVEKDYGEIPWVYCSPGQLNQVFMNVLKNAAQAIQGKGEIRIRTIREGEDVYVRIRDTGTGITPQQLERIFDLQFNAKSARVRMGSGLSMAYLIVQAHGGDIRIDSEVGKGTEVAIRLPVRGGREIP